MLLLITKAHGCAAVVQGRTTSALVVYIDLYEGYLGCHDRCLLLWVARGTQTLKAIA